MYDWNTCIYMYLSVSFGALCKIINGLVMFISVIIYIFLILCDITVETHCLDIRLLIKW